MKRRCPRCGSENREERERKVKRESYKSFGKLESRTVNFAIYKCDECGLIYKQEE